MEIQVTEIREHRVEQAIISLITPDEEEAEKDSKSAKSEAVPSGS
jgi:hypothetical protein